MTETEVRPCVIQIELAAGTSIRGVHSAIAEALPILRPLLATDPVIEDAAGFGARRSTAAVLAVVSFAVGVSQGVAGNAVWQLLQSVAPDRKSVISINGTVLDRNSSHEALERIERLLTEGSCLRPKGE